MKRILIFSGTTEGRELAEFLRNRQVDVIVSVATEYGRDCMDVESSSNVSVRTGRMDETQIRQFLTAQKIDLVVDATHIDHGSIRVMTCTDCIDIVLFHAVCSRSDEKRRAGMQDGRYGIYQMCAGTAELG